MKSQPNEKEPKEGFMKPVTQINFFSIKPGKIDEFIEAERSYAASTNLPPGLTGSRMPLVPGCYQSRQQLHGPVNGAVSTGICSGTMLQSMARQE
jgi:hypothetical protein